MLLVFVDFNVLEYLSEETGDQLHGPDEFISALEDKLDSGELTIDEVRQYLIDYEAKQR